ncbi:hypothetical protein GCM10007160_03980 [Litchfieldella qijiaojingensis]|uniref:LysM domain-containing protein n=1 Tax=Litchfieldella qijiaojingensis TaxID=980347 RepID=A0ABQ2YCF5_9GAMM|nr:hypothetical protein [Halomonas qijiaojingensis]GGX79774.1 hypothetical protein GCM10007160_03980 [Halomonas qijiaojingensis]
MFGNDSRYKNLPTVTLGTENGEAVAAVKLRVLGQPRSRPAMVTQGDQLDVISQRRFKSATRYWHIADANSELEANSLTDEAGRMIQTPEER